MHRLSADKLTRRRTRAPFPGETRGQCGACTGVGDKLRRRFGAYPRSLLTLALDTYPLNSEKPGRAAFRRRASAWSLGRSRPIAAACPYDLGACRLPRARSPAHSGDRYGRTRRQPAYHLARAQPYSARNGTVTSAVHVKYSYDKEKREALEIWGRRLQEIVGASVPASWVARDAVHPAT